MQKVTDNIVLLVLFAMTATFILATAFVFFFLRYQRRASLQKEAMQRAELEHRSQLLHTVLQSQEDERRRIGRDLHDDVGAALSNLRLVMGTITGGDGAQPGNQVYKPLIDNIITTVRNISHSLMPPGLELFGLEYTLHELCDAFNLSGELKLTLHNMAGDRLDQLGKKASLALYRVIQELLSNTVKHAGAKNVLLCASMEGPLLVVEYSDDGKGMTVGPAERSGMGMQNIESRLGMIYGSYDIISSPGNGFKMTIKLPLSQFEN